MTLFPKAVLPCIHIWAFHKSDTLDDYFRCENCPATIPYEPEEINDIKDEFTKTLEWD